MNNLMQNCVIPPDLVRRIFAESGLPCIGKAGIREINKLARDLWKASGKPIIQLEIGNPGHEACRIGVEAQIRALRSGVAANYAPIEGILNLKIEASRFILSFLNLNVNPANCIPTVGSMQGGLASFFTCRYTNFTTASQTKKRRDSVLLIGPHFVDHKPQVKLTGSKVVTFDISEYRGKDLYDKLEEVLSKGNIHSLLYSNPNNPTWMCLTDEELRIIGELANKYKVVVIEDLAYFGMDFREDYSVPGVEPYQPTVGKYADYYILMISSSKIFSYAGERISIVAISDKLAASTHSRLKRKYGHEKFINAFIYGVLKPLTSGTGHSVQYAMEEMLRAVNDGTYRYRGDVIEYGLKAELMKKAFTDNGFYITYDEDCGEPIADGFYFTYCYPGFTGAKLVEEMLYYGISGVSLETCSGKRQGVRACCSLIKMEQIPLLAERLEAFAKDHPIKKKHHIK